MPDSCLTPAEQERVHAYDERTRKEIEAAERPPTPPDAMKELQEALEGSRMDCLRDLQEDIAALILVRERWPDNPEIRDRSSFHITMDRYQIEELRKEIRNARS